MAKKKAAKKKVSSKSDKATSKPKKKAPKKKVAKKAAAKVKKPKSAKATPALAPTEDAIRVAAYLNYASRIQSGAPGDELGDWLAAEKA